MTRERKSERRRLRCFVAMAFDKSDTDDLYNAITRSLKKIGVTTVRVDRIEHNDDIDDRIISEIREADFVLADLTYARPSVYFEAGYAQRMIPVIYTTRRDHFRAKIDDPNGNLRVHFDLQMKNIIAWSSSRDPVFLKRLESRILKVTKPLTLQKLANEQQRLRVEHFDRSSQHSKQTLLRAAGADFFKERGYSITELTFQEHNAPETLFPWASKWFWGAVVATKQKGGLFHFVFIDTPVGITKKLCEHYRLMMIRRPLYSMKVFQFSQRPPKAIREDLVIMSLGTGGIKRARTYIPYLHSTETADRLAFESGEFQVITPGKVTEVTRRVTLHIIESSARLVSAKDELRQRFDVAVQ